MGVYIPGMEMPRHCGECGIEWCDRWKQLVVAGMAIAKERPSDCPLVPVPPHGDLIDRDALACMSWKADEVEDSFDAGVLFVLDHADELPTIIPADPAEEGET